MTVVCIAGLGKALREAIALWASEDQALQLTIVLREVAMQSTKVVVPNAEFDPPLEDWETGVEHLAGRSTSQLYEDFGLADLRIPTFNHFYDAVGEHDPWNTEDVEWYKTPSPNRRSYDLRYHQLCCVDTTMRASLRGESMLLLDAVGLGKTVEAIALIAMRAYFYRVYEDTGKFPGKYGEHRS